jgi:protease-4
LNIRGGRLVILSILAASLLLMAAGLFLVMRPRRIPEWSLLQVRLSDSLPEEPSRGVLGRFLGWREITIFDLVQALDAAGGEERVRAVTLRLSGLDCGLSRAQEIRLALTRLREKGTPVTALLEKGGTTDYYVATAADEVYLLPGGSLDVTGLVLDMPLARGTLDRLGITPDFVTIGEYKGTPEVYTRSEMSPSMRENLEAVAESLFSRLVSDMARRRGLTPERFREIVDEGFLSAEAAVDLGLVDGLLHADVLRERAVERVGEELEDLTVTELLRSRRPGWLARPPRLALVYVTGVLVTGESVDNEWAGDMTGSETITRVLREVREDEGIEAVILRLDTPGGSAAAAETVWRAVEVTAREKPVIVSMGDYAASGGYYIAAAGDELLAQPSTITGSLGVFSGKFAMNGLYDWVGLNWGLVKRGRNADMFLDLQPWTDEQRELIRRQLEGIYGRFVEVVAGGREMTTDEVLSVADGRIYSGEQALELGLVDRLGGLREAIEAARSRAGLPPGARVRVDVHPRPAGWLASLTGAATRGGAPEAGPLTDALREAAVWETLTQERVALYCPYRLSTP